MATVEPIPRIPVLIFGPHITALGVLRTLARRGIECYVVDATSNIIVRSRWYRPVERTLPETSDSEELAAFLASLDVPRAALIACSDRWTSAVAGLPAAMQHRFPASVPPREVVDQLVDKGRFRALVDRLGIAHPRTLSLRGPSDIDLATDEELANGFLKPTESQLHNRHFGTKGSFVHSREEAAHIVEQASGTGVTFMLQEWIPGNMSKTVLLDGFVDRDGRVSMMARRRVRMNPPRLGNTVTAVTIRLEEVREATTALRLLLAEVKYRGIFNVEFKFDERDGHFKIIEINPRPAWFIATIAKAGMDLPWMSYLDAQDLPVPESAGYRVGRYGVYELEDAAGLLRAWRSRHRPEGPVLEPWLKGDHVLFWWTDPLPALADVWPDLRRLGSRALGWLRRAITRRS